MTRSAKFGSLPFREQIRFFRDKVRIPTRAWTDIWEGMHARGFVVAGAIRDELLADFQEAIAKAQEQGTTLAEFRKDFDAIVQRHGWRYKGGRGWRTRVIYQTNLRTSYQAGRYAQMQAVKRTRPFWRYRHNDAVERPRPQHQAWDSLVLDADDAWWDTHFPPNGWGCKCFVQTLSRRELEAAGKSGPDDAPAIEWEEHTVGTRGPSPRTVRVPTGIDPGWGYNVGKAAWGRVPGLNVTRTAQAPGWVDVDARGPEHFARPASIAPVPAAADLLARADTAPQLHARMREAIGDDQVVLADPRGERILVGQHIVDHILEDSTRLDGRERYFSLIPDLIEHPYEVWVRFMRHESTGLYGIRKRYVKVIEAEGEKVLGLVGEAVNGYWVGLTVFRGNERALGNLRKGLLVWGE